MKLNDFIDAQLEIEAKATPGPWRVARYDYRTLEIVHDLGGAFAIARMPLLDDLSVANAQLVISARDNIRPLLLALQKSLSKLHEYDAGDGSIDKDANAQCISEIEALLLAQQGEK